MSEQEVIIDGEKYKPMVLGVAPNLATDLFYEKKWYTLDPRKQKKENEKN